MVVIQEALVEKAEMVAIFGAVITLVLSMGAIFAADTLVLSMAEMFAADIQALLMGASFVSIPKKTSTDKKKGEKQ